MTIGTFMAILGGIMAFYGAWQGGEALGEMLIASGGCSDVMERTHNKEFVSNQEYQRCFEGFSNAIRNSGDFVSAMPGGTAEALQFTVVKNGLQLLEGRPTSDATLPADLRGAECDVCPEQTVAGCPDEVFPVETIYGALVPPGSSWSYSGHGHGTGDDDCDYACNYGQTCEISTENYVLNFTLSVDPIGWDGGGHPLQFDCTAERGFTDINSPNTYYSHTHRAAVHFIDVSGEYLGSPLAYGEIAEWLMADRVENWAEPCP